MEEQQDDVRAAEVLVADLEPRPGGRLLRGARLLGAVVAELAWGLLPGPSVSDVVVRRRDDGTEVLRVPAGEARRSSSARGSARRTDRARCRRRLYRPQPRRAFTVTTPAGLTAVTEPRPTDWVGPRSARRRREADGPRCDVDDRVLC